MVSLRHQVRMTALQILFEVDATDHALDLVYQRRQFDEPLTPDGERTLPLVTEGEQFLQRLVFGVWEHRPYLDRIIEEAAPNWPITQMPGVDKAILRIALFELLIDQLEQTPVKAVINEAVELAKQFGSDNSSRFVNGVLGTVVSRYRLGSADL
ncbi:transcription antitermination factor NusB [Candidatus Viridilinea mediisalina]|uniref:transcription antitermination factor NusB n=1 Tax=Candidatus Viridilinea mediisalina TaxID=2024553 RepID=UPI001C2C634A|nr:transcription antitermination factor NusB [Candidatus Viridilinea mediisalina]